MCMVGHDAVVKEIMNARVKNKALSIKHNLSMDYNTISGELIEFNRLRLGIPLPAPPSFFQQSRNSQWLRGAVVAAKDRIAGTIRKLGTGTATLADWIGDKPVSHELAEQRAAICVGCPQHKQGDLLSFFTRPVSDLIRRQIEEKEKMNLSTSKDSELNICDACGCPMKLKVHVPLEYIMAHIKKPEFDALDERCWMRHET